MTSAAVRESVGLLGTVPGRHITDATDLTRPPVPGAASLALRAALDRPRFPARVIAVFPTAIYLELRPGSGSGRGAGSGHGGGYGYGYGGGSGGLGGQGGKGGLSGLSNLSGRRGRAPGSLRTADAGLAAGHDVLALVTSDAVRLPNSVVVPAGRALAFETVREGDDAWVGDGYVEIVAPALPGSSAGRRDPRSRLRLRIRVRRWWDPAVTLTPVGLDRLEDAIEALEEAAAEGLFGLAGHAGPVLLADRCAAGDLARAVDAAERIVGLGPGLTPSGDDILAGLLVSMRSLGAAVPGGDRAIRMADWLGAAVTAHAGTRTTALAATLLGCAARGEAGAEVAAVLRGISGLEPLRPAARRLLTAGHTSGTDLIWGLLAGCRAVLALAVAETGAGVKAVP